MSVSVLAATGEHRDASEIYVRDENNVSRMVTEIWIRDENNVSRRVWGGTAGGGTYALAVSSSTDNVSGAASSSTPRKIATNSVTATATGGVEPYTYAWAAGAGNLAADAASGATTTFSAVVDPGESMDDMFICTVTDALGNSGKTGQVAASVSNFGRSSSGQLQ